MPIIGTIASSTRQGLVTDTGAMFPLQVITVGPAGAADVTFTNIPNTYTHLQIRGLVRTTASDSDGTGWAITVNSDTGANYSEHRLIGTGSAVQVGGGGSNTVTYGYRAASASQLSNTFGAFTMDVLDYANTNKFKTIRGIGGYEDNSSGRMAFWSGSWQSTSALTSIKLAPNSGNWTQNTQFALYAVKAAS